MLSKKIIQEFEEYCKKNNISETEKKQKLEKLKKALNKYYYEPGEAIGIITAQSISEPATQMTMRSYTMATQSDRLSKVTQGLPRLIEIFDARKTFEKNMVIYVKKDYNTKEKVKDIALKIKESKVSDLIKSDSIDLVEMGIELELENEKHTEDVKNVIVRYVKDADITSRSSKIFIKPKKDGIKSLRKVRSKVLDFHVYGVKGIENVVVIKENEDWLIQTTGTNFKKVLKVDGVDILRTRTNDIHQVFEVFGIEGARNVILREAKETLDEQGLDVDERHITLLADMMTLDGDVKAIGRYGISGKKSSVLARANFEETKRHLVNASFYGETDNFSGTIENILIGQIAPIGTGMIELGIDLKKMKSR